MKTSKWVNYLLVTILALIALGAVGFFAYRFGLAQGAAAVTSGASPFFMHRFGMGFGGPNGNMHVFGGHMRGRFFFPFFGLGRLLFYGLLIWIGYKLIQGSGWKLVKETPAANAEKSG